MGLFDKLIGKGEMIKGIDHVAIIVSDMDRSIKFYTEVLELKLILDGRSSGGEKKSFLGTSSKALVALSENKSRSTKAGDNLEAVDHIAFAVADAQKSSQALAEKGIEFIEIKMGEDGKPLAYHFLDPDGLELEISMETTGEVPKY